ncbi:uncharacterized protein [Triticum aestivum]|uniref:uncharacterized protein isoform X2 n=1 Tax=Triticum aestivum TaxID=4565 RepID=UPI001D004028|nr:uncharacterized protein LOC123103589 isoform X2 [Triticum aestivum]
MLNLLISGYLVLFTVNPYAFLQSKLGATCCCSNSFIHSLVVVRIMNKGSIHKKETHGTSDDISENTPVEKVRGPNLFERAKEEIEALVEAVHDKMEHHSSPRRKEGELHKDSKEHSEANMHKKTHENETHGTSNHISEDTPVSKVKGPGVFERAKEEIEAIVEAIHPKKESDK